MLRKKHIWEVMKRSRELGDQKKGKEHVMEKYHVREKGPRRWNVMKRQYQQVSILKARKVWKWLMKMETIE